MRAIVTGIKPYLARLTSRWADHNGPRFHAFEPIQTKQQVIESLRFNGNTGNYFVGEGAVEAVGREKATFIGFDAIHAKTKNESYLDLLHSQFDCVVLVTANLLRSDYDAALEADLLSRLRMPVVVMGIGCQRKRDLPASIPAGTLRFLEVLKSKEHYVFARGAETTDYLVSKGLQNVWATGCPSAFLRSDHVVGALRKLKSLDWSANLRIAFSGYVGRDLDIVGEVKAFGNRQGDFNYVLQDEPLFYGLEIDAADGDIVYNDMSGELTRIAPFKGSPSISDLRLRIFFNTHQWRTAMAMHDLSFGRRFHGTIAALQAGIPGIAIAVDDRMREMLVQLEIPYIEMSAWNSAPDKLGLVRERVAEFDVDRFEDRFLKATERFRERLRSIGLG